MNPNRFSRSSRRKTSEKGKESGSSIVGWFIMDMRCLSSIQACLASRSCSRDTKSICKASNPKMRLGSATRDGVDMGGALMVSEYGSHIPLE
jgi:hypothetical protein